MSKVTDTAKQLLFLIQRKRLDEAEQLLGEALLVAPDDFVLIYFGAQLDFERGRLDRAEAEASRLLLRRPQDETTRYLLFRIALERGDVGQALERVGDLCRDHPQNADYATTLAAQLLYSERFTEAAEEAERALGLDAHSKKAQEILAYSRLARGDEGADRQLQERLHSDPHAESTRHLLLTALVHRGAYGEALEIARAMLSLNPRDSDLLEAVKELRILAHPSQRLFLPFDWLERKGLKKIILIPALIVGVLKGGMEGLLPETAALPILTYLAIASLWPWLLRRWLD